MVHWDMWERCYETLFDGHIDFPSVRKVMLPSAAISPLKCFSGVRMVYQDLIFTLQSLLLNIAPTSSSLIGRWSLRYGTCE